MNTNLLQIANRPAPVRANRCCQWVWLTLGSVLFVLLQWSTPTTAQEAAPVPPTASRFLVLDVVIDSGPHALAAYQVEIAATNGTVKIVGIEGGEPAAFRQPPYYDPAAIQRERVILGAFTMAAPAQLTRGAVRVASIHCQVFGNVTPGFSGKLIAAASSDGRPLPAPAVLKLNERKQP